MRRESTARVILPMSYRSLKALLGETNLERKCLILFGFFLFVLISLSFWWYGSLTEDLVNMGSQRTGRGLVDALMLRYHWEKLETIDDDHKTFVKVLGQQLDSQEYSWSFLRPQTDGVDQPHDEFEWQVLQYFLRTPPSLKEAKPGCGRPPVDKFKERRIADKDGYQYQYYQPVRAKKSCIDCHTARRTAQ